MYSVISLRHNFGCSRTDVDDPNDENVYHIAEFDHSV